MSTLTKYKLHIVEVTCYFLGRMQDNNVMMQLLNKSTLRGLC